MRARRASWSTELLLLAGIGAAPAAWTAQLTLGYAVGDAACNPAGERWGVDAVLWVGVLTGVAAALAVGGLLAALAVARAVRRGDADDPRERLHWFALGGVLVSGVFLALILLGGIGTAVVDPCRSS